MICGKQRKFNAVSVFRKRCCFRKERALPQAHQGDQEPEIPFAFMWFSSGGFREQRLDVELYTAFCDIGILTGTAGMPIRKNRWFLL